MLALPVLVIAAVIVAVLVARERSEGTAGGDDDGGQRTLRRVFVYSLALLGAMLTASGLSGILRVALSTLGGTTLVSEIDRGLAMGLALTIVGLPVWVLAWRGAGREAERTVAERRSLGRRLHLAVVRTIALGIAVPYAIETGQWLAAAEPYEARAVARLLVWGALWAYHERVAGEVPFGSQHTRRIDRIEVYLAATAGFALLALSVNSVLARSLRALYEFVVGSEMLMHGGDLGPDLRSAAVTAVVGAVVWWWHWLAVARRDRGSTGWFVYLFLVGVLSGTVTAIISASVLLHRVLAWVLDAWDQAAAVHFEVVPSAIAGLGVGVSVWGYHRAALREAETTDARGWSGPERLYRYLVVAAGMLTAAGGVATILMVGLDLAIPGRTLVETPGGIRDVVAVGLTLLSIGAPLWARFWSGVQGYVRDRPEDRTVLARRGLIFGAFGAAIIVTVVALTVLLFELFDTMLAGQLSVDLIEQQRWSIALLLTAGAVSVHYGLVLREDRAEAPEQVAVARLRHVVVVAPRSAELAGRLRDRVDARVTVWERQDIAAEKLSDAVVGTMGEELMRIAAPRALAIVEDDGTVRAIPLEGA